MKNAWRMNNIHKDKWYIIYAKTPEIKKEWMDAFQRERRRVQDDSDKGRLTLGMLVVTITISKQNNSQLSPDSLYNSGCTTELCRCSSLNTPALTLIMA